MKLFNAAVTIGGLALLGAMAAPDIRADAWNRKTVITFGGPVEIPGVHLPGWGILPAVPGTPNHSLNRTHCSVSSFGL